jgi:DNA repair protein RadA/Sms
MPEEPGPPGLDVVPPLYSVKVMAATVLVCEKCGHRLLQWAGRCPRCGAWDSVTEEAGYTSSVLPPVAIEEVDLSARRRLTSGMSEFDRVLGGGLVTASTVLLAGEPGVGKSTLVLQVAAGYEREGSDVLLVCGEETAAEVAARAARVAGIRKTKVLAGRDLAEIAAHLPAHDIAVVDSIQAVMSPGVSGEPGSPSQVRAAAGTLGTLARDSGTAVLMIGHVTKDGAVAGPRTLEHLVDAVLMFDGAGGALRTLRSTKNRFGTVAEVGVFEMGSEGLKEVPDASRHLLAERGRAKTGSAVGCVLEGRRPLALEVQALVVDGSAHPRRVTSGLESSRVGVVAAVLDRHAGVRLMGHDVYASVPGGFRVFDPAFDLALALALAGAKAGGRLPPGSAAVGEVGLGGEIRSATGVVARMEELRRLGFERVLTGPKAPAVGGIERRTVEGIGEALNYLT